MDDDTPAPPPTPALKMIMSPTVINLTNALVRLQRELKPVPKRSVNPGFNSLYASLPDIMEELLPLMSGEDLALMQFPTDAGPRRAGLLTIVLHSSGEYIGATAACGLGKDDAQAYAGGITYLRRYALAALGVVTDTDDDGNSASATGGQLAGQSSREPQRAPQRAPQPTPQRPAQARPAPPAGRGNGRAIDEADDDI